MNNMRETDMNLYKMPQENCGKQTNLLYQLLQFCECWDSMGCTIKALQDIIVDKCEILNFHYFVPPIVGF